MQRGLDGNVGVAHLRQPMGVRVHTCGEQPARPFGAVVLAQQLLALQVGHFADAGRAVDHRRAADGEDVDVRQQRDHAVGPDASAIAHADIDFR